MTDTAAHPPVDLLIVGAGPTGLFGAFYAGMRSMSVALLDSLPTAGGQLATLYPEKYIYDVAGFPKVLARDLVNSLVEQANTARPVMHLDEAVETLDWDEAAGVYRVGTARSVLAARTILIAAGVGAFEPRKLDLPNAAPYEGHGLHYFVSRVDAFRDRRVLIVGGGDSAIDWANMLAPVSAWQMLIHRRDQFRAHEQSVRQMLAGPTDVRVFHELAALQGDGRIERTVIYDNRTKERHTIAVDEVVVNIGFASTLGPIRQWGLELQGAQIKVDPMMQTNRPGIFAAGDIAAHPGKLKLIATGFAEAAIAVNFAKHHIDPKANVFPGHSTNLPR